MGKHKTSNCSLEDSREKRKKTEQERRKQEKEYLNKIKDIVCFKKQAGSQIVKKDLLRYLTAYLKFYQTFEKTNVQRLPAYIDVVFQAQLRSDDLNVFVCVGDTRIIFGSESSFKGLGYQFIDVFGHKLSSLVYDRDRLNFENQINELKKDIIESKDKESKPFVITCRMMMRKNAKNDTDKHHLVRIIGSVAYHEELVTNIVTIEKAANTHLSIRKEETPNPESGIVIRGSIRLIEDPDHLSSQINYMLVAKNEYRLVMDPAANIFYGTHTMVNVIGWLSIEVQYKNAYDFIHVDDRNMSLAGHLKTLKNDYGIIVQRLKDVKDNDVYLQIYGFLQASYDRVLFVTHATQLSNEEGERRRKQYEEELKPFYNDKTFDELLEEVKAVSAQKIASLMKSMGQTTTKNNSCVVTSANSASPSTDTSLQIKTSSFSSSSSASPAGSSFHSVLDESTQNEYDISSITSEQSSDPSSLFASQPSPLSAPQLSPLLTSSSSLPALSASPSLPSSSEQSTTTQSPLSSLSQSPPIQPLTPQTTSAPELLPTRFLSESSSTSLSTQLQTPISTTISINYPSYNPQIIMRPTHEHLIQNQYYQFGSNHCNIIITTQTYPEQPTLFGAPVNQQIILNQTSFSQLPTYNYHNAGPIFQNVASLDNNAELQKVNINDFVYQLDSDSDSDIKK